MLIVTMRTDKPEAEIGVYDNDKQLSYLVWPAHRQLAETIHTQLRDELQKHDTSIQVIEGIVVYQGPGSFTGLRIGIATANAIADGLKKPIVGAMSDSWITQGIQRLLRGETDTVVVPEYGALPNITAPRK